MTNRLGLILILIAILHQAPANGDQSLIKTVCGWTPSPEVCQQCLSSAVGSDHKDEKELAAISINCASSLSDAVIQDFVGIRIGTGDDAVKEVCGLCEQIIEDAKISLVETMLEWSGGQFHDAGDKVANAGNRYSGCFQMAQGIKAPPAKFDDFSNLKKYYLNTKAILYKL